MPPRERIEFSPTEARLPLKLPDGVRMVIWPVFSLKDWNISRAMARMVVSPPQGAPMLPDHPNWSWPVTVCTKHRPMVALLYNFEVHDIVLMNLQHQTADMLYVRAMDAFNCLYAKAATRAKIMSISVHPCLSGQPHRIGHAERTFTEILSKPGVVAWTGEQILNCCLKERPLS